MGVGMLHKDSELVFAGTRQMRRLAVLIVMVLAFVIAPGAMAYSAVHNAPDPILTPELDARGITEVDGDRSFLPIERWRSAAETLHYRLDAKQWEDLGPKVQVITNSGWLQFGNALWSITFAITDFAARLDPMDTMGQSVDDAGAAIARAVTGTPVIAVMLVATIIMAIWLASKGGGRRGFMQVVKSVVILAVLASMSAGAAQSTTTADGKFVPGKGSPAWLVRTTSDVVESMAGSLTQQILFANTKQTVPFDPLHCTNYVQALHEQYLGGDDVGQGATVARTVPLVVSFLWEQTGLQAYKEIQFGDNVHADRAYCQLLEYNRGTPWHGGVSDSKMGRLDLLQKAGEISRFSGEILVDGQGRTLTPKDLFALLDLIGTFGTDIATLPDGRSIFEGQPPQQGLAFLPSTNNGVDRSMIGWAACRLVSGDGLSVSDWQVNPGWTSRHTPAHCLNWWVGDAPGGTGTEFDYDDKEGKVRERLSVEPESTFQYVMRLHGSGAGGMTGGQGMIYTLSAGATVYAFGVPALAKIVASYALIVMVLLLPIVLVVALWPGKNDDRLVSKFTKTTIGLIVITFGFAFVLSLIATLAVMFARLGQAGDLPSIASIAITGLSPWLAWVVLSWVFKTLLHAPNPLSVKGALAYGGMAGVAGGVIGGLIARGRQQARQFAGGGLAKARGMAAGRRGGAPGDNPDTPTDTTPLGSGSGGGAGARGVNMSGQSMNRTPVNQGDQTGAADGAQGDAQEQDEQGRQGQPGQGGGFVQGELELDGLGGAPQEGTAPEASETADKSATDKGEGNQSSAREVIEAATNSTLPQGYKSKHSNVRGLPPLKDVEQVKKDAHERMAKARDGQDPSLVSDAAGKMAAMGAGALAAGENTVRESSRRMSAKSKEALLRMQANGGAEQLAKDVIKGGVKLGVAGAAISTAGIAVGAGIPVVGAAAAYGSFRALQAGTRRLKRNPAAQAELDAARDEKVAKYIMEREEQAAKRQDETQRRSQDDR